MYELVAVSSELSVRSRWAPFGLAFSTAAMARGCLTHDKLATYAMGHGCSSLDDEMTRSRLHAYFLRSLQVLYPGKACMHRLSPMPRVGRVRT